MLVVATTSGAASLLAAPLSELHAATDPHAIARAAAPVSRCDRGVMRRAPWVDAAAAVRTVGARTILITILNINADSQQPSGSQVARLLGVSVRYGDVVALAEANASFERGTTTALVGANGSGKSTVLRLLAGLLRPSSGTVERAPEIAATYVAQQHGHHRWMPLTVREVLRMGSYRRVGLLGRLRDRDQRELTSVAERLEVADLDGRGFDGLSGGQQQRVLVAQALVGSPTLLLLDEPITGLDLPSQATILRVMAEHASEGGAVVFSTHHLAEARRADRVLLLAGEVVADGPPADVLRPELLAAAFGGRVLRIDESTMLVDDHGHGADHTH
jgi:ABC-type Mn2+/Zn2+ transport system ATPase subunit